MGNGNKVFNFIPSWKSPINNNNKISHRCFPNFTEIFSNMTAFLDSNIIYNNYSCVHFKTGYRNFSSCKHFSHHLCTTLMQTDVIFNNTLKQYNNTDNTSKRLQNNMLHLFYALDCKIHSLCARN